MALHQTIMEKMILIIIQAVIWMMMKVQENILNICQESQWKIYWSLYRFQSKENNINNSSIIRNKIISQKNQIIINNRIKITKIILFKNNMIKVNNKKLV
jgi:hypothetical protein